MSSAANDKPPGDASHSRTIRAVLRVRQGAGTPFEGTVEVGTDGPRVFHGWLELMGQIEEARAIGPSAEISGSTDATRGPQN